MVGSINFLEFTDGQHEPEYKEIEITQATKGILQYTFGREVFRAPPLLIRRYPQAKDHDDLFQRA